MQGLPIKRITRTLLGSAILLPSLAQAFSPVCGCFYYDDGPLALNLFISSVPPVNACQSGETCVGDWVQSVTTPLAVGTAASFDSHSNSFSFALGALRGHYQVTLSPSFSSDGWRSIDGTDSRSSDELNVLLANRQTLLQTSSRGMLDFTASPDQDYYLFLNGAIRGNQTYQLSLSPVPEPETWAMLLAGLGVVAAAARRKATSGKPDQA